jgi:hypothetical protein
MIEIYQFAREREGYTLLVIEESQFQPVDIDKVKSVYPVVDKTQGVVIAGSPNTNWITVVEIFNWYAKKDRSVWQGVYYAKLKGILVGNAFSTFDRARAEVIPAQLPCLECYRQTGKEVLLKPGTLYPYCTDHQDKSPHRVSSRRKK